MTQMNGDILFKSEDWIFSYRVAGVLIHNGRILLQKPKGDDGYSLIGGHVAAMETTQKTLEREFMEELHASIDVGALCAVGEVFFPWGKRPCHQIALYYRVNLREPSEIPLEGVFHGYDDLGGERINLDFCWIDLKDLPALKVYPQELKGHLCAGETGVFHFVSDQLEQKGEGAL